MFNKESLVVKAWVNQITADPSKRELVPKLSNLQEVVYAVLDSLQEPAK